LAYVPVAQNQRHTVFAPANDPDYQFLQPAFPILDQLCRQQPGNVLAYINDGHYIRYHTSCSVLANNFLLTPQHFEKVAEVNRLLRLSPEEFAQSDHDIDYLLVRFVDLPAIVQPGAEGIELESVFSSNPPLFVGLNLNSEMPQGLQLIAESVSDDQLNMPYVRIFRVLRQPNSQVE
ncbi:MAG: hypothetical protein OEQ74_10535, partial [Gammaproteobacteria bacterium]|nr:hypothetical protein [Gammaproteobacteria bacterium]